MIAPLITTTLDRRSLRQTARSSPNPDYWSVRCPSYVAVPGASCPLHPTTHLLQQEHRYVVIAQRLRGHVLQGPLRQMTRPHPPTNWHRPQAQAAQPGPGLELQMEQPPTAPTLWGPLLHATHHHHPPTSWHQHRLLQHPWPWAHSLPPLACPMHRVHSSTIGYDPQAEVEAVPPRPAPALVVPASLPLPLPAVTVLAQAGGLAPVVQ